jgi:hypothetical protein
MVAVVLTTANHYVLDIAGSIALLGVAIVTASLCGRLATGRRHGGAGRPARAAG